MWFPPIELMTSGREASAFLLLAWHEMFDPYTPDSYQPRLSHTGSLVSELLAISERAKISGRWIKHVTKIQEELRVVSKADSQILDLMPRFRVAIETVCHMQPVDIIPAARTLQADAKEYETKAVDVLERVSSGLPTQKEAALEALRRVATIAIRTGRSPTEFHALANPSNITKAPTEIATMIASAIKAPARRFTCILAVSGDLRAVQVVAR